MDEIVDLKRLKQLLTSGHSRSSSKCYRCKSKRIPCDYTFPKCSNCEDVGIECQAWTKGIKQPLPRSIPLYLEDRVAQLEIQLDKLRNHELINSKEEQAYELTKYASAPFLQAFETSESSNDFSFLYFNSSTLPAPFDRTIDKTKRGNMKHFVELHPPVDLYSIPKDVLNILSRNYIDFHLPQYPLLSKTFLTATIDKVFSDNKEEQGRSTQYEKAIVSIILAISAATLTHKSERHALSSSSALFSTLISLIYNCKFQSKLSKLQIVLLIAHYAFANPYAADIYECIRSSIRLCLDLGLHKEVASQTPADDQNNDITNSISETNGGIFDIMTPLEKDSRRRLYLVFSSMTRHLSSNLKVRFPISQSMISVELPTTVDDEYITAEGIDYSGPQTKSAALHFHYFRLCETEIHDVLWQNKDLGAKGISTWIEEMEGRVEKWFLKAEEFGKVNQLRFRLISKYSLYVRLTRRTPRIRHPSHASFIKCTQSIISYIDEYMNDYQSGQVSYLYTAVLYMTETAACLLDIMWFESDWILQSFELALLIGKLNDAISLLHKFGERWPDINYSSMIPELRKLSSVVSERLSEISKGSSVILMERDPDVSSRIEELLFPLNGKQGVSNVSTGDNPLNLEIQELLQNPDSAIGYDLNISYQSNWQDHFNVDDLLNLDNYDINLDDLI